MKPEVADNAVVRLSLRRPITMLMILVSATVLGFVALARIPLELIPSGFSAPFLSIQVQYPDATARDVEEKITLPIEQAVATTPGLDRIQSTSRSGSSRVMMVFKSDTSMDIAYREVRDRIARIREELPEDVKQVEIRKESADSLPVAIYAMVWEPDVPDPYGIIERKVKRPLERIDGVGLVNLWGETKEQVYIEIDRELADAHGIDIFSLVQTLRSDNFAQGQGSVREGDDILNLRTVALWQSPEEIANLVIGQQPGKEGGERVALRLKDIATVQLRRPDVTRYDRYNQRPALIFGVVKESQANTVEVSERIKAAIDEAATSPELARFSITKVFVQGDTIKYSLEQVVDSGRQGGVIALLVLLFFLRRLRLTILIALAIPLSLFLSLPFMYFSGQTINLVSLIGLMICIGLVVDNSVVVAENISRFRRRGLGPYAAALQGTGEVALAITLATMTTVIVFLPASLLSKGTTQFFMVRMVTPVCVSLLMSLFVAVVLVPLASATVLRDTDTDVRRIGGGVGELLYRADAVWKAILTRVYEATVGRINRAYGKLLAVSLRRRMDVIMVSLLALGSTVFPATRVRCASGNNFGTRNVTVHYSMPSSTTLQEADTFFSAVEVMLEERAEELNVEGTYVGFDDSSGRVQVFFNKPEPGQPSFKEMAEAVIDVMPERPGWEMSSQFGRSDGAEDDAIRFAIYGLDHDAVQKAREELEARIVEVDGVIGIHREGGDTRRRDEMALRIERDMSQRFGVPASVVANTVAWAIRGAPLTRFHTDEREIDVLVRYAKEDRTDVDDVMGFSVPSQVGARVPIQTVAVKTVTEGEAVLTRFNKRVSAVIALDISSSDRTATLDRLRKFISTYRLPEGLSFDADQGVRQIDDMQRDLMGALALGTIFILLIMGFLFESFVLPLSVLPSIPLSFVGVYWFLWATGEDIDGLAGIGMVLLLGVVVNNAIVLVDFINGARKVGLSRHDAIIKAGTLRFRPIMMTALTTIGGMLPLAFARHTGEGIPYGPFGKTLVGGMITATILTLLVVPVMYTLLDDLRTSALQWWQRLKRLVT